MAMACCISPLRRSTTLAPHRAHPHTAAGLQTPITGRFVVLGLPDLNVLVMGANAQAFCSSGIGEDVAGNRLEREAFHPANHGIFGSGFRINTSGPPARPSCRAVRGSRSTDPAGAAALGPVVLWEIALPARNFGVFVIRFACRLCCPSILQKWPRPGTVPSVRGAFLFQDAEMGCASFFSA